MSRLFHLFVTSILGLSLFGQEGFLYEDHIYDPDIRSVKFHIERLVTSFPIIDLNSDGRLVLTFDDILGGERYLQYKIIHCDKDWNPSDNVTEMDFLEGFNDEEIENIYYSVGTKVNYTNYELFLPNEDVNWRISGNYVLLVYDKESLELVLTRRFIVAENRVSILPEITQPIDVSMLRSHQEINFVVNHKNFDIERPLQSLFATVIQNGRWDNMIANVQPKFNTPNIVHYDRTQSINFEAYKEFRSFDLRSTRVLSNSIHSIDVHADRIDVLLRLDRERTNAAIVFEQLLGSNRRDINGNFIIETRDDNDSYTEAEYVHTFFNFKPSRFYFDHDIYLFGKFTDWKIQDKFRLEYDATREVYRTHQLLKQGYYDYIYAMVDRETGEISSALEGNWYETENDYTILLYYRKFGERYDRIIGVRTVNSLGRRG